MGLTDKQIQKRWDANFKAVQDSKQAALEARDAYSDACYAVTAFYRQPGFRRKQLLGHLTADEVDAVIEVEEARTAAYEAVQAADEAVRQAQARFKAGVPEEDD